MSKTDVAEAADGNMISEITLRRAKDALGAIAEKDSFKSGWTWKLPGETLKDDPS
jgi:hypothetical protein